MKQFEIVYLDIFKKDLEGILRYISIELDNKLAAYDLLNKVEQKISLLAYNPEMYPIYRF